MPTQIWVQSPHNTSGYFTIYGDESLHNDHFNAHLSTGDTTQTYARTGYLGFLRRTESVQADGGNDILIVMKTILIDQSQLICYLMHF